MKIKKIKVGQRITARSCIDAIKSSELQIARVSSPHGYRYFKLVNGGVLELNDAKSIKQSEKYFLKSSV